MAWTSPMTFVANQALTASQLNTHLKENLQEVMPAKAFTTGGFFVTATPHRITQRLTRKQYIDTTETTAETDWTDLTTIGPTVTCQTGDSAMAWFGCRQDNSASGYSRVTVEVGGEGTASSGNSDGGSSVEASDDNGALVSDRTVFWGTSIHFTGLTPGTNTFTMKYRVSSGTGTFRYRRLIVMPL